MASKIEGAAEDVQEVDDLDIIHPERQLKIAGRDITVREYSFVAGLRLRTLAKPFTDGLYTLLSGDRVPDFDAIGDLLGEHWQIVLDLVAESAELDRDFIDSLDDADGNLLLMAWWSACGPFFLRSAMRRIQIQQQEQITAAAMANKVAQTPSPGATSTPASSPTATNPATAQDKSAAIPGDSFCSGTPLPNAASASNAASE
jgi:hypothetical protein